MASPVARLTNQNGWRNPTLQMPDSRIDSSVQTIPTGLDMTAGRCTSLLQHRRFDTLDSAVTELDENVVPYTDSLHTQRPVARSRLSGAILAGAQVLLITSHHTAASTARDDLVSAARATTSPSVYRQPCRTLSPRELVSPRTCESGDFAAAGCGVGFSVVAHRY